MEVTTEIKQQLEETFAGILDADFMEELVKYATIQRFKSEEELIGYGEPMKFMPLLLDGSLKVFRESSDGRELLLYYVESGDTCAMTIQCCFGKALSNVRVIAEEDGAMIMLPIQQMEQWIAKYPSWRQFILSSYSMRMTELFDTIDSLAFKQLDQRLWEYLTDKVKIHGELVLNISHEKIAEELNSSRVVISRLLKDFEHQGKVKLMRNKIEVKEF